MFYCDQTRVNPIALFVKKLAFLYDPHTEQIDILGQNYENIKTII